MSSPVVNSPKEIPWEKKVEVATKILSLGNTRLAAELSEVSLNTVRSWKKSEWWPTLIEELKQEQRAEATTRLGKIAATALDVMEDRLLNGEHVLNNKTGEMVRKPVGLRDASTAANNLMTQQARLEQLNNRTTEVNDTVQDVLKQLAGEFAKFTRQQKTKNAEVIEFKEVS